MIGQPPPELTPDQAELIRDHAADMRSTAHLEEMDTSDRRAGPDDIDEELRR